MDDDKFRIVPKRTLKEKSDPKDEIMKFQNSGSQLLIHDKGVLSESIINQTKGKNSK